MLATGLGRNRIGWDFSVTSAPFPTECLRLSGCIRGSPLVYHRSMGRQRDHDQSGVVFHREEMRYALCPAINRASILYLNQAIEWR